MTVARVVQIETDPAVIGEELLAFRAAVLRQAQACEGFVAAYDLVDRENGAQLAITLWESVEAMRASERARRADAPGGPRIREYEVVLALGPSS